MDHPPKPRLVLNVGVTGHRSAELAAFDVAAIRGSIRHVLQTIREVTTDIQRTANGLFASDPPLLRMVSRMADGADLMVANEAAVLGYQLQCPLPFVRTEYQRIDIDSASQADFSRLVDGATAVLELDGPTKQRSEAFIEGRRAVSRQCDVLIAIWDPASSTGQWGTTQIVKEARRDEILTVVIPPQHPETRAIELGLFDAATPYRFGFENLDAQLRRLLLPLQEGEPLAAPPPGLETYYGEKQHRVTRGFLWRVVRDLLARFRVHLPRVFVRNFDSATAAEWSPEWKAAPGLPPPVIAQVDAALRPHFMWADNLANYYADLTRSTAVFIYLMGAIAVLLALIAYALGWTLHDHAYHAREPIWIGAELGVILLILFAALESHCGRWHERWVDYRLIAEHMRLLRPLMVVGRVTPCIRLPAHLSHGDARGSWMHWLVRAVTRQAGMISARLDPEYVDACRAVLQKLVQHQTAFHENTAEVLHAVDRHLRGLGYLLFGLTGVACLVHLLAHSYLTDSWLRTLTFLNAVLPAFGAACAATRNHLQLERLQLHSRALAAQLGIVLREKLSHPATTSRTLGALAEQITDNLTTEVLDWRTLFKDREIEPA